MPPDADVGDTDVIGDVGAIGPKHLEREMLKSDSSNVLLNINVGPNNGSIFLELVDKSLKSAEILEAVGTSVLIREDIVLDDNKCISWCITLFLTFKNSIFIHDNFVWLQKIY